MSFGIGLGSFVDGLKSGVGIRRDQETYDLAKEDRLRRIKREEEDRAFELEDREFRRQEREFARQERDRAIEDRREREKIQEDAAAEFERRKQAGEATDKDFDVFWNDYTIPKMRNVLLEQGDYEGASALDKWAESADAKRGAKLTNSALLKAQTGDHEGALNDILKVSKINGYIDQGYKIMDAEPVVNPEGQTLGYRMQIDDGTGNVVEQDVALQDIPQLIATFANPAAAFESQIASQAAKAQRETELADFQTKEQIKANVKKPSEDAKLRADAIKSITEEEKDRLDDETPKLYDLPRDLQEQKINERISVLTGEQPMVVPRAQVIADTELGQVVPVGITQQQGDDDVLPERNDEETLPEFDALDLPTPKSALERAKKYGN